MGTGALNMVIGLVLLGMGASGRFKLLGASPKALMILGVAVILFGVFQIVRSVVRRRTPTHRDFDE